MLFYQVSNFLLLFEFLQFLSQKLKSKRVAYTERCLLWRSKMVNVPSNFLKKAAYVCLVLGFSPVFATTASLESLTINQEETTDKVTISLKGEGFGEKSQVPPVLWVFGDDVRQNGVKVDFASYQIGAPVATTGPKIWEYVDNGVTYSSQTRYPGLNHSYFVGNNGTVRFPLAFGGSNPPYSDKVYMAARIKAVEAWHKFRSIRASNVSGRFDLGPSRYELGESITVENSLGTRQTNGKIVFLDSTTQLVTLETDDGWGKSDLDNAKVTGNSTGATMSLSASDYYSFAIGSKYLRMWSGGSKPGLFNTMATNRLISGYRNSSGTVVSYPEDDSGNRDTGYGVPDITSKLDWRLLETYVDQSTDSITTYVDVDNISRRYLGNIDISDTEKFLDRAPTISQLGIDAAGGAETIDAALHFGEIYFDTTPKRIMISDESTYSDSGAELELQYPVTWSENNIIFEFRPGALDTNKLLYVYIFDENGNPNSTGMKMCIECEERAPKAVELYVD
tara:strand:- start:17061 stop:18581 length:1521 start_codon:yes stop_codon:yes gene_type:complete